MELHSTFLRYYLFAALTIVLVLPQTTLAEKYFKPASGAKVNFTRTNAHDSLKDLLDIAVHNAKKQINAFGSFAPFGIVITRKGQYQVIVGNGKDSQKDLVMIRNTYRRKALSKTIVAAAIVYNSSINVPEQEKPIDAIYINSDSIYTGPKNGYQPYAKTAEGKYRYEKMVKREEDTSRIFQ